MQLKRSSGIILHPTSLPGRFGIGSLGAEAFEFVDFLADAGQSVWQILPLGPTGYGDSPYSAFSAFAGNPLLICLERLVETGDLNPEDIEGISLPEGKANYGFVHGFKERLLHQAAHRFQSTASSERRTAFEDFCAHQGYWVNDYSLFRVLRSHFDEKSWNLWPRDIRKREEKTLRNWEGKLDDAIYYHKYAQFIFFEQWFALKDYANSRGIKIFGDIPIFVAFDSADVWANPHLFHLDENGNPTVVAGVPPDYFSATGQRWGNPLYRWDRMAESGFSWWIARFRWNQAQTDLMRIDHFRGFEACWSIPASEETAINGRWTPVPGEKFFRTVVDIMGEIPVIAEDLGMITPEVEELRDRFGFPGMKVLQFAFGSGPDNPYLPHNLERRSVIYTGTHDNTTTPGWWQDLSAEEKEAVRSYLDTDGRDIHWDLIRLAMLSVADLSIFPLQDVLGLGANARMNAPGSSAGNWSWRYLPDALTEELRQRLAGMCHTYGRLP